MDELQLSRSQRSHYIWHIGVRRYGALWGASMLLIDIWSRHWPRVPIALTPQFALDVVSELIAITIASIIAGVLFGYFTWYFLRWFLHVQD